MKKIIVALVLVFSLMAMPKAYALEKTNITYLENGYYIITTDMDYAPRSANTVSRGRTNTVYNADDEKLYSITLNATFTYNGTSATCTSATPTAKVYATTWKNVSKTATKSGNKCTAQGVFSQYYNGHTIDTDSISVSITCSPTGVLS